MKKAYVVLNIDEDALLEASDQSSLGDAVSQELGWLHDSGMFVDSWSFDPPIQRSEGLDELLIRIAHMAGCLEAKGDICEMEWDDLRTCVQDVIRQNDENSERYLEDPSRPEVPSVDELADQMLRERFSKPDSRISSFFYTFGTSNSFPFQKGWVEVQAQSREEADGLFRSYFPNKKPGTLNCSSIYSKEDFLSMLKRNPDMPSDWKICHKVISQASLQNKRYEALHQKITAANEKKSNGAMSIGK